MLCNPNRFQDFVASIVPASLCQSFTINPMTTLPLCYNDYKGTISMNTNGGIAPYTFVWLKNNSSYSENTSIASNLDAGIYQCTGMDGNNCIMQTPVISISQPMPIVIDTNLVTGVMTATASGGTPPYQFEYSNESNTY